LTRRHEDHEVRTKGDHVARRHRPRSRRDRGATRRLKSRRRDRCRRSSPTGQNPPPTNLSCPPFWLRSLRAFVLNFVFSPCSSTPGLAFTLDSSSAAIGCALDRWGLSHLGLRTSCDTVLPSSPFLETLGSHPPARRRMGCTGLAAAHVGRRSAVHGDRRRRRAGTRAG
jgi:hypothetical protein